MPMVFGIFALNYLLVTVYRLYVTRSLVQMMDPSNPSPADGLEVVYQNGVYEEPSYAGMDSVFPNDVDPSVAKISETASPNGNGENAVQLDKFATDDSSLQETKEESNDIVESNNVTISRVRNIFIFLSCLYLVIYITFKLHLLVCILGRGSENYRSKRAIQSTKGACQG